MVCRAVATGEVDVNQLAAVLDKVLSNNILPPNELHSYALLALEAPAPELRRLAVKQLRHLAKGNLDESSSQRQDTVIQRIRCIGDCDVRVSTEASQALLETASLTQGLVVLETSDAEQALSELTSSSNPTVCMRALSFVISLAGISPAAAAAVRERGYLEPLAKEVGSSDDILGCVAALQLVTQLAQQAGPAATQLLDSSLIPNLVRLARSSDNGMLKGRALRALGSILAASTAAGADDPLVFPDSRQTLSSIVLGLLELVLSPTSEAEAEVQSAAFEVVEEVVASRNGATLLATHRSLPEGIAARALATTGALSMKVAECSSRSETLQRQITEMRPELTLDLVGESSSQISALHAFADLCGAGRAEEDRSSAAALLGESPEARLQDSLYSAAGRGTPAEILWARLRQPFSEHRIAAYRLLAAIAMREWGAREACSHTALLNHLCDPRSESGEELSHWRFACTQRLVKTAETAISGGRISQQDTLRAAYPRLSEAALQGPYGAGAIRPPIVATEMG